MISMGGRVGCARTYTLGLHRSQTAPAPHSQASQRLLRLFQGRSRWFSQTHSVSSHVVHPTFIS